MTEPVRRVPGFYAAFAIVALLTATPEVAHAQAKHLTGHYFDKCMARDGKKIMAWSPSLYTWCLWNAGDDQAGAEERAISRCTKALPRFIRRKAPCRLAYDGTKIVDPLFRQSFTNIPDLPATIEIFDRSTKSKRTVNGHVRLIPYRRNQDQGVEIFAEGERLCTGRINTNQAFKSIYVLTCAGQNYQGQSRINTVVSDGGFHIPVTKSIKLRHRGSYIKLSF